MRDVGPSREIARCQFGRCKGGEIRSRVPPRAVSPAKHLYGLAPGTRVVIVEDEITTGRTVIAAVRALRAAGVTAGTDSTAPGPFDDLEAVIQAAGDGGRLGRGPKAFVTLGGRTLLERAVDAMRLVARSVVVGVPREDIDRARELGGPGVTVVTGGATRRETLLAIVGATHAPWLILHDVVHPFVTPALTRRVVETARAQGAAAAAVPTMSSAYYRPAGRPSMRLAPGDLWLTRKPVAFRREAFVRGLGGPQEPAEGIGGILRRAGQELALVSAEPWNIKITTPEDWQLAEAIEQGFTRA